ncbi:MAG: DUF6714 family protein [Acidobacteriota bacterium]|mgnify:CR=1 FL=1
MTEEERRKLKLYCLERKIIGSQVFADEFIKKVKLAFVNNKYPGDDNLVSSAEHRAKCDECKRTYDFLVGKTWEDCLNEESYRKLGGAQSYMKPLTWHYYLPAYLIQLVKNSHFSAIYDFEEFMDKDGDLPEIVEMQNERINLLTSKQCEVIIDYLEITFKVWEGIEKGYQDDTNSLNYWKRNYQKALSKEKINK